MKEQVQALLDAFYQSVSFQAGKKANFVAFSQLFSPMALIVDYDRKKKQAVSTKNLAGYIESSLLLFETYPEIEARGFLEKELSNTIELAGDFAFVQSICQKEYFNGERIVQEKGLNSMHLIRIAESYKILSIGYYEGLDA